MILIVNVCKEKLHYFEFVKPIEDILKRNKIKYFTKHYKNLRKEDLKNSSKVIICGTSLKDESYLEKDFSWIKDLDKPVLGICSGMQIIGLVFGGKVKKKTEIGFYYENFKKEFLGLKGKQEVYHLHNNYILFPNDFDVYCKSGDIVQAVKHKKKEIYGVLFHPEVRNKGLVEEFVRK